MCVNRVRGIFFLTMILTIFTVQANVIWPALLVSSALFESFHLVLVSVCIEAGLFYLLLPDVSVTKSCMMSVVGNFVSVLVGSIVMTFGMLLWHLSFDYLLGGTFSLPNRIISYLIMYAGSTLIEVLAIRYFFKYQMRLLWVPAFLGNAITYALLFALKLSH